MKLHYYLQVTVTIDLPADSLPDNPDERDEEVERLDGDFQSALYRSLELSSNIDNGSLTVSSVELAHSEE